MSPKSWTATISQLVKPPERLAVIGIGSDLRGDDAAGVEIVRALKARRPPTANLLLVEAGPAPENITSAVRRFQPNNVLLIDAIHMHAPPGTIRLIDLDAIISPAASTHTPAINLLTTYLTTELGCKVILLGIQPAQLTLDAPLSPPVQQSINAIINAFCDAAPTSPRLLLT